jgi:hypothetical protein
MSIPVGSPVVLKADKVSTAGGVSKMMGEGTKGRVCRDYGNGFYCVRFESLGCRRVGEGSIEASTGPAPQCDPDCVQGCW